uniref:Exo-alpha-sialidase n=1 Tax=Lates calcarifer TaxID=8187 RepID=A0A4W6D212_LATCA
MSSRYFQQKGVIHHLFYEIEGETLLAFAEQRETADDASIKNLVMSRGTLKNESSGAKTIETKLNNYRPMNPCPVFEKNTNTLFLFFIHIEDRVTEQWQIKKRTNKARHSRGMSNGMLAVEAVSENGGADFHTLSNATKLVETGSGCQGSVVSFPAQDEGADTEGDPKWLLYTHPSNKSKKTDLGVYVSKSPKDPSKWSKPWIINSGPSGYSDLVYIGNCCFACLVECGVKKETEQIASVELYHL